MSPRAAPATDFPRYSPSEAAADRVVHIVGVGSAVLAVAWLLAGLIAQGRGRAIAAGSVYGAGLLGMLGASAAFNLVRAGRLKAVLRRVDHAMIFVMIAGSYTPVAVCALPGPLGWPLLIAAWIVAALGAGLKLRLGNRYDRGFIVLYLAHGWMLLAVIRSVAASVPGSVLMLLAAGGVVYTAGVLVHTKSHWPFQNAIWHAMVLIAAMLHFVAVGQVLALV